MDLKKVAFQSLPGFTARITPEAANEELEKIRAKNDGISAMAIVNAAKPIKNPLHKQIFYCGDAEAALQHRLEEARLLMRATVVVVDQTLPDGTTKELTVRKWEAVRDPEDSRGNRMVYRTIEDIYQDDSIRQEFLDRALSELRRFQVRYAILKELSTVFDAINAVLS